MASDSARAKQSPAKHRILAPRTFPALDGIHVAMVMDRIVVEQLFVWRNRPGSQVWYTASVWSLCGGERRRDGRTAFTHCYMNEAIVRARKEEQGFATALPRSCWVKKVSS